MAELDKNNGLAVYMTTKCSLSAQITSYPAYNNIQQRRKYKSQNTRHVTTYNVKVKTLRARIGLVLILTAAKQTKRQPRELSSGRALNTDHNLWRSKMDSVNGQTRLTHSRTDVPFTSPAHTDAELLP